MDSAGERERYWECIAIIIILSTPLYILYIATNTLHLPPKLTGKIFQIL